MSTGPSLAQSLGELLSRAFAGARVAEAPPAPVSRGGDVLTVTVEEIAAEHGRGVEARVRVRLVAPVDAAGATSNLGAEPSFQGGASAAPAPSGGATVLRAPPATRVRRGDVGPWTAWLRDTTVVRVKVALRAGDVEVLDEIARETAAATRAHTSRGELLRALVEAVDVAGVGGLMAECVTHEQRVDFLTYKLRR